MNELSNDARHRRKTMTNSSRQKPVIDLTERAVKRQVAAMGVDSFEVGVLIPGDKDQDRMLLHEWTTAELLGALRKLKRHNAMGRHIFIRPLGSQGLVFVDDLTIGALQSIANDGLKPACVIESSPQNYQAWFRISREGIAKELASAVGKLLARRYNGDQNSTDWRHFGRLAGFTNRKPKYVDATGKYPYVLLTESTTQANDLVDSEAITKLLDDAKSVCKEEANANRARLERLRKRRSGVENSVDLPLPAVFYKTQFNELLSQYGEDLDLSGADWKIGQAMAETGYRPDQVCEAMLEASPKLNVRKSGHVADYVNRTVSKLFGELN